MNNVSKVGQELHRMKSQPRFTAVIVFGALVELLVVVWTAIHNIPLLTSGVDMEFKWLAILPAVLGEVFVIGTFALVWFLRGWQRRVALTGNIVMVLVLLANSDVRFAQLTDQTITQNPYFQIYATFVAPVLIFILALAGVWSLTHLDPEARKRDVQNEIEETELEIELATARARRRHLEEQVNNPEHDETLAGAAQTDVRETVRAAANTRSEPKKEQREDDGRAYCMTTQHLGRGVPATHLNRSGVPICDECQTVIDGLDREYERVIGSNGHPKS